MGQQKSIIFKQSAAPEFWLGAAALFDLQVASAMVDLASVLKLNDRPEEAQDNLQHALSIYEEALGEEHTSVAAIQQALAELPLNSS